MDPNKDVIDRLVKLQLESLLAHLSKGHLSIHDRESAAKCLSSLALTSRLQAELPIDISRITEGSSFEDALARLDEDT